MGTYYNANREFIITRNRQRETDNAQRAHTTLRIRHIPQHTAGMYHYAKRARTTTHNGHRPRQEAGRPSIYPNAQREHTTTRNEHMPQHLTCTYPGPTSEEHIPQHLTCTYPKPNEYRAHAPTGTYYIPQHETGAYQHAQRATRTTGKYLTRNGNIPQRATSTYPDA